MQTQADRIEKKVLNLILVAAVFVLAATAFIALSSMKYERPIAYDRDSGREVEKEYPGGRFISNDIYERCQALPNMGGKWRMWYWADGRITQPGGVMPVPCWR